MIDHSVSPERPLRRPRLSTAEVLAMSRMLRLYLKGEKFLNPITAMDTARLAEQGMNKLEAWRDASIKARDKGRS